MKVFRRRFFGLAAAAPLTAYMPTQAAPVVDMVAADIAPVAAEPFVGSLLTNDLILREAIMHLNNNLVASKLMNRDFEREFGGGDGKIRISRPIRGIVGAAA